MRRARIALVTGCFVGLLAACVGGPGPLPDQGPDQASQGGGVTGAGSGTATGNGGQSSSGSKNGSGSSTTTKPPPPVTLRASDYDQECELDSDCMAVFEGSACTTCACPNAAISSQDATKYAQDRADAAKGCPDEGDVVCEPCGPVAVGCNPNTKRCGIGVSSKDAG